MREDLTREQALELLRYAGATNIKYEYAGKDLKLFKVKKNYFNGYYLKRVQMNLKAFMKLKDGLKRNIT